MQKTNERWSVRIAAAIMTAAVMMTTACGDGKEAASSGTLTQEASTENEKEQTASSGAMDQETSAESKSEKEQEQAASSDVSEPAQDKEQEDTFTDEMKELYAWMIMYADTPLQYGGVDTAEVTCKIIYDLDPDGTPAINAHYYEAGDGDGDVLFYMRNGMVQTYDYRYREGLSYKPYSGIVVYSYSDATQVGQRIYTFPEFQELGGSDGEIGEETIATISNWWGDEQMSDEEYMDKRGELGLNDGEQKDAGGEGDMTYEELLQFLGAR